jgi:hypothetical protein
MCRRCIVFNEKHQNGTLNLQMHHTTCGEYSLAVKVSTCDKLPPKCNHSGSCPTTPT